MSFIQNVVEAVNENQSVDARKNLTKLNSEIKNFQSRIRQYLDSKYLNFIPQICDNGNFILKCENFNTENTQYLDQLSLTEKKAYESDEDALNLQHLVDENVVGLKLCKKLLEIDAKLKEVKKMNSLQNYSNIVNLLSQLKLLIYDTNDDILPQLECYSNIKIMYIQESELFMHNLKRRFESLVEFKDKTFQNNKAISIKISKNTALLEETLITLTKTNYNPRNLCNFLVDNIFQPIVTQNVTIKFIENEPDEVKLFVSYNLNSIEPSERSDYRVVFHNLKKVLSCLNYLNVKISDHHCINSLFAEYFKEKLIDMIINETITYAIPNDWNALNDSTLSKDILELYNFLCSLHFLKENEEDDQKLKSYGEKIRFLFSKRYSSTILKEAIVLMKKDLHDLTDIECPTISEDRIAVSKSTIQLTALLERLLSNAKQETDEETKSQLKKTPQIILERYGDIVCSHHEKLLTEIPQQAAIFHNNCFYLAEWIIVNGDESSNKTLSSYFVKLGKNVFNDQVSLQSKEIFNNLNKLNFTELVSELGPEPNKIIRQCLRQLEVLKNVWENILPKSVYTATISQLLNECCHEIITKIFLMDDITSTVANELADLIDILLKKGPNLYKEPAVIYSEVKLWLKLNQLKMILGASLIQISEQWSEGKGPLTLCYKSEELKHLIRALFQNSDRRAAVLAVISQ